MPSKTPPKTKTLSLLEPTPPPDTLPWLLSTISATLAPGTISSNEPASDDPDARALQLAQAAKMKAALVSGTFSLPPGPLGIITALPELLGVWKIQAQMVADIAATFGQAAAVNREQMVYCLFKNLACQVTKDVAIRVAERAVVRRASMSLFRRTLWRVGVPIVGAAGAAAYAWYDTHQVAKRAIATFQLERAKSKPQKPARKRQRKVVPFPAEREKPHPSKRTQRKQSPRARQAKKVPLQAAA